MVSQNYLDIG